MHLFLLSTREEIIAYSFSSFKVADHVMATMIADNDAPVPYFVDMFATGHVTNPTIANPVKDHAPQNARIPYALRNVASRYVLP